MNGRVENSADQKCSSGPPTIPTANTHRRSRSDGAAAADEVSDSDMGLASLDFLLRCSIPARLRPVARGQEIP